MVGYDPVEGYERAFADTQRNRPFQRFNFTGMVSYRRDVMLDTLGKSATPQARQTFLRDHGTVFHVSRNGGSLIDGREATNE